MPGDLVAAVLRDVSTPEDFLNALRVSCLDLLPPRYGSGPQAQQHAAELAAVKVEQAQSNERGVATLGGLIAQLGQRVESQARPSVASEPSSCFVMAPASFATAGIWTPGVEEGVLAGVCYAVADTVRSLCQALCFRLADRRNTRCAVIAAERRQTGTL